MPLSGTNWEWEESDDQTTAMLNGGEPKNMTTRSSWFNCALRDDEAVYWVSIGQFEAVAVGD